MPVADARLGDAIDAASIARGRSSTGKLIVIGFVGGRVKANDEAHREVQLCRALERGHADSIDAAIFANGDSQAALRRVLRLLDRDDDGELSERERSTARIVLYGHSWGASEAIALARSLNHLRVPVLLTVQVDSVAKPGQDDRSIPPNVHEAINFYQSEGLLRGRRRIVAVDPDKTKILGNFERSYRGNPVSCDGYPWYARAFMHRHVQIENDPEVWRTIEEMILTKVP